MFWKFAQYTLHWDKTQVLKKIPLDKIKATKNALFFLLQKPTHYSFTFNLWFLCELNTRFGSLKVRMGFSIFKVYKFLQQKAWTYFKSSIISFKIKTTKKPHTLFLPDLRSLSCNKKFQNSVISTWLGTSQKLLQRPNFLTWKIEILRITAFLIVTLR